MNEPGPVVMVRAARPADQAVVVEFNRAMAVETEGKALDNRLLERGVQLALEDPRRGLYFVAEIEGKVVGQTMVTFEWSDWRCAWFWWLQSVYVHPDCRGCGVFKALYAHIAGLCRAQPDTCGLRLYVEKDNRRALDTYLRLGMSRADYLMLEVDWSA